MKKFKNLEFMEAEQALTMEWHVDQQMNLSWLMKPYQNSTFPIKNFLIRAYLHYIGNGRFDIFTHYEHFSLRDANSNNPNFFYQFGILRDD